MTKNNMPVVNTCLDSCYTLHCRPRNTGRRGGGVGVLTNNQISVKLWMELIITVSSITIRLSVIYLMLSVKLNNSLKQGTFCNEFNDYLQKLPCMNGNIVIVGNFNINWLNTNGSERKQFCNLLENFGFVQNIYTETHRNHQLLDYIIT